MRKFRLWMITVLAGMLLFSSVVKAQQTNPAARPFNVVFILADDLGWSDTSLYGQTKFHRTPNLDRLASRGMKFTRAYSASPLCSPTRSAIMTGLSPARTGITTPSCHVPEEVFTATLPHSADASQKCLQPRSVTRLKKEYRTLAESLKEAGYATGHFGKWHLGREPYSPLQQGFDVDIPHHPGPGPAGSYVAPWKFENFTANPQKPDEHIEDRMAQEAVDWMESCQDRPFFLNYWMFSVHAPFDAKPTLVKEYASRANPEDEQHCPTYAAMIQSMDDAVGTLLDALDRLKLSDRTIIIFTADNGGNMYSDVDGTVPTSNRPLRGGKATMFEGGTRVPGVIVWPGVTQPASISDSLIQSEDYYPTLLDGLRIAPSADQVFDGISIIPALRGEDLRRDGIVQFFPHAPGVPDWLPPAVSIHERSWKLIRLFHGGSHPADNLAHRYLLYDLSQDLSETTSLAVQSPEVVQRLDQQIAAFLSRTGAVVPVPNPQFDASKYRPEDEGIPQPKEKSRTAEKSLKTKGKQPSDASDPALLGWKVRGCEGTVRDGILRLQKTSKASFLGFAAGKHRGTTTVTMRMRCSGGRAHVAWLPNPQASENQTAYSVAGGEWETVSVRLPVTGSPGIVRVYLPADLQNVEIDRITITSDSAGESNADF